MSGSCRLTCLQVFLRLVVKLSVDAHDIEIVDSLVALRSGHRYCFVLKHMVVDQFADLA